MSAQARSDCSDSWLQGETDQALGRRAASRVLLCPVPSLTTEVSVCRGYQIYCLANMAWILFCFEGLRVCRRGQRSERAGILRGGPVAVGRRSQNSSLGWEDAPRWGQPRAPRRRAGGGRQAGGVGCRLQGSLALPPASHWASGSKPFPHRPHQLVVAFRSDPHSTQRS